MAVGTVTRLGLLVVMASALAGCRTPPPNTSGGPLLPEQAAYDVRFYDLELHIDPDERRIHGTLTADVEAVEPLRQVVLDLDDRLEVDRTWVASPGDERDADFEHRNGRLAVDLGRTATPGTRVRVRIDYGGRPRVAPRPPWEGGFTWAETASGAPWIGVSCQGEGADLWWPVKDHPSDEPDSMWIAVTVPDTLTAVSNGRLEQVDDAGASHHTFRWRVGYPINPYAVTVNVAPYLHLVRPYESVSGAELPLQLWVLPERRSEGEALLEHYAEVMAFLEQVLGPYPFPRDKAAVVHAPFLGMEHQTAIAYGGTFLRNIYSFDWLLLHELAHEWFGNRITVDDWRHLWIHEGFATYLEALYAEHLGGPGAGQSYLLDLAGRIRNERPLVPESPRTAGAMYFDASVRTVDADVYVKGAWVLHTLRWLIGDEAFFRFLRDLTAPDMGPSVDTREIVRRAEAASGRPLGWFFDAYLRMPSPPHLVVEPVGDGTLLRWETGLKDAFPLPVEVRSPDGPVRLDMRAGRGRIPGYLPEQVEVDPDNRILRR